MQCLTTRGVHNNVNKTHTFSIMCTISTMRTVYITEYTSFYISARGFDCTQTFYADTFGIKVKRLHYDQISGVSKRCGFPFLFCM